MYERTPHSQTIGASLKCVHLIIHVSILSNICVAITRSIDSNSACSDELISWFYWGKTLEWHIQKLRGAKLEKIAWGIEYRSLDLVPYWQLRSAVAVLHVFNVCVVRAGRRIRIIIPNVERSRILAIINLAFFYRKVRGRRAHQLMFSNCYIDLRYWMLHV